MLEGKTIGFLGAGNMAEALLAGLLAAGLTEPERIWVTNRSNRARLHEIGRRFGVRTTPDPVAVVAAADVVVLACKPKDVAEALDRVGGHTRPGQVLLSVVAGISTAVLAEGVNPGVQIVRAMPNTSSQVRASATAICAGPGAGPEAVAVARAIMGAVGTVVEVPENLMDAVTGLSGSGPAYIYLVAEAMVRAGAELGLEREVARHLTLQTLLGAARMLVETQEDPAQLRHKVTSPGGTTWAALSLLKERGFAETLTAAIARAAERSREMGEMWAPRRAAGD